MASSVPYEHKNFPETAGADVGKPDSWSLEELKYKTIYVDYFVPDTVPSDVTLKRMQYYVRFLEWPGIYYFGFSFHTESREKQLALMAEKGSVIRLDRPIILAYPNDLFLDSLGNIISARGHDPLNDPKKQTV